MPTKPRIIVDYHIYQVCSRGVDNLCLFKNRKIRKTFLNLLNHYLLKFSLSCYSYSFTINQYFLVLRSTDESISRFMQRLNSAFARKYNRLTGHRDAVMGRRFDSLISKNEIGLSELIRFVNLEPVRKNHCTLDELDHSAWSAHSTILGYQQKSFVNRDEILNQFSSTDRKNAYREFIRSGYPENKDDEIIKLIRRANSGRGEQIILGDELFVQKIYQMNKNATSQIKRHIRENMNLEKIHDSVAALLCLETDTLYTQGRQCVKSTARELFAYVAVKCFDFTGADIARYLKVCRSAVSRMISRFENIAQKEMLKKEIEELCNPHVETVPI